MIALVPKWAHHYDEFWTAIRRRNLWFIRLRYFFALLLLVFLVAGETLLAFNFDSSQKIAIFSTFLLILGYNLAVQIIRPKIQCVPGKFNCLHLSLVQIILDLSALFVLISYTGIVESPIYPFFIFQMIVGSLILPGYVIYTMCGIVTVVYSLLIVLQYKGIVASNYISGLYLQPRTLSESYIILFIMVFASMMAISVLLANRIARSLYKREQELRENIEKLHEAEFAKQKYIMGVVHEIKTPVSAVQSIVDLILQKYLGPVNEKVEEKLIRARKRSEEAIELINNILRISKLRLLNVTNQEKVILYDIISSMIDKYAERSRTKGIDVSFYDNKGYHGEIIGDKVLIELALSNLICNAIKYNTRGGIVRIKVERSGENVIVEISDDGIGIPKHEQSRIFEQFFRGANTKNCEYEGSGMGLSLVYEITQRLGIKIATESPSRIARPDRPGTTFLVYFSKVSEIQEREEQLSQDSLQETKASATPH
ncbi:MAG: hypothetical protein SCALA702_28580 [Melioribacteraceae bacterium]|nr:MAG: hypothetical protein SCALA702_28580 [Melioribacteraceae bacterium]